MDFTDVYKKHYYWVFTRFNGKYSAEQAHECAQEVFLLLYKRQGHYDPKYTIKTFLTVLCRNVHYDFFKINSELPVTVPIDEKMESEKGLKKVKNIVADERAIDAFNDCDQNMVLEKIIGQLDVNLTSKTLLRMSLIERRGLLEMQAATGKDSTYVRRTRIRAMKTLAESLNINF